MSSSAGSRGSSGCGNGGGDGDGEGVVLGSGVSKVQKSACGNRRAMGWGNDDSVGDARKFECEYCKKVILGGIPGLKGHLEAAHKETGAHRFVSYEFELGKWEMVPLLQERWINELGEGDEGASSEGGKRKRMKGVDSPSTNIIFRKNLKGDACKAIASFFYNNAIPFSVAKSDEFKEMVDLIARHGIGFEPPSDHEIGGKYLEQQVISTKKIVEEHKIFWKRTGCSILIDGWTDQKRRTVLKFSVNCPYGTIFLKSIDAFDINKSVDKVFKMMDDIVEEVGEENVVQIVTDNNANYKAAGKMLMEKRKKLYWTPCASHCIELMFEDFEKKIPLHKETIALGKKITAYIYSRNAIISLLHQFTRGKDLVRPAMTRFATSYLTLGCLNDKKGALVKMFTCKEWKSSQFAKTKDGKFIENLVVDGRLWKNIGICLRAARPLLKVLRLVNLDEKPAMCFIYEEMHQAKEKIQKSFNGVKKRYMPLWDIIDERWDNQLHMPLRAAGYYLNPQIHYSPKFKADFEVTRGLYDCIARMGGNVEERNKIHSQLENFNNRSNYFGSDLAIGLLRKHTPGTWWDSFGFEHPEVEKFAIRVTSLTCSSYGCERNWSAFEMVHSKRRNRLKQKKLNDVVFVMANSKLAKKKQARWVARPANEHNTDYLSSDDEWIVDSDENSDNFDLDTPNEHVFVQIGENAGRVVGGSKDDLEIPDFDDDEDNDDEDNDGEDDMEDDDYDGHDLKYLLDI